MHFHHICKRCLTTSDLTQENYFLNNYQNQLLDISYYFHIVYYLIFSKKLWPSYQGLIFSVMYHEVVVGDHDGCCGLRW